MSHAWRTPRLFPQRRQDFFSPVFPMKADGGVRCGVEWGRGGSLKTCSLRTVSILSLCSLQRFKLETAESIKCDFNIRKLIRKLWMKTTN